MKKSLLDTLFDKAQKAAEKAYVPYSNFKVGAALLADDGSIFTGCNIENRHYKFTVCPEEVALMKALSEGKRSFKVLVMVAPNSPVPLTSCGSCRHMFMEFMSTDALFYFKGRGTDVIEVKLGDLLPYDYFNTSVAEIIRSGNEHKLFIPEDANLTPREQGIYQLLISGKTAKEISEALYISVPTVNFHICNVYKRLGVKNKNQLFAKYGK
ncbi:cytidine deaminase [Treponema sp. R80B11-R83G3]